MLLQTNTCEIRRFDSKDLDQLYLLIKDEAIRDSIPKIYSSERDDAKHLLEKIANNNDYFAIMHDNQIVAIAFVEALGKEELKFFFALRHDMRHKGILLETIPVIIEWLKINSNCFRLLFSVKLHNISSLMFIKELGAVFFRTEENGLTYKIDLIER